MSPLSKEEEIALLKELNAKLEGLVTEEVARGIFEEIYATRGDQKFEESKANHSA